MDPKQAKLDPKLKEAYDRVMGSAGPTASPTAPMPQAAPTPMPAAPAQIKPINPAQTPLPPAANVSGAPIQPPTMPMAVKPPMPAIPQMPVAPKPSMPIPPTTPVVAHAPVIPQAMSNPPIAQPMTHPVPPQITTPAQTAAPQMQQMHAAAPAAVGVHTADRGYIATKKKGKISPVILIMGGVVFLLVYTLFWLKFFNVPIPFISQ